MKVVLFQPDIPQNTGNIARTCAVTGSSLTLVKPLGFSISDRYLKRAGLDYWNDVNVDTIDNLESYLEGQNNNFYFFSSKATKLYTDVTYGSDDILIFGSETQGLPQHFYEKWPEKFVTIPMVDNSRCLNISNAAAVAVYEALRQLTETIISG
ncbi:MAG: tRNA (cytidine(34)-2'-O)-methyltransferase [Waddliaceae bacterium]|nr:tRNA (cytidine(34)-2'-O)-methyltransferase [Waddliaceae bacterium]MBT3578687.1 tRNA (cytidine(34)-2'-O)-methyltransferase [Waddliaceae bacterium]MBT4445406.1 tRNA (cytidine(34)-2'-O)-methyltransferase [Waddliaceae bacterium]MBT6928326.1 tRNA (cytidine(34)-2'-O)-methyltransferase [Waddliaceae bacterium]MBT7265012.1 tRNA (cytidine(34)-2'-O)-methyltransferase [Waddliaceae bacterium]